MYDDKKGMVEIIPVQSRIAENNSSSYAASSNLGAGYIPQSGVESEEMDLDVDNGKTNSGIVLISTPQINNYDTSFYNSLIRNIATNKYDAADGKFISATKVNVDYWTGKELLFDESSNGTYLISIIDENGKKIAMGYTDEKSYNEYMSNLVVKKDGREGYEYIVTADGNSTYFYENGDIVRYDKTGNLVGQMVGEYRTETTGDGNTVRRYNDGSTVLLDKNNNIVKISFNDKKTSSEVTYNGIGDLRREESENSTLQANDGQDTNSNGKSESSQSQESASTQTSDKSLYNGIGDLRREESAIVQERADGSVYMENSFGDSAVRSEDGKVTGDDNFGEDYIDLSKYGNDGTVRRSVTDSGSLKIGITTDNKTYQISEEELVELAAVVYGEAVEGSFDDALGVISVIANRADNKEISLLDIVHGGEFHGYNENEGSKYDKFIKAYGTSELNEGMQICLEVVRDCILGGVRNNNGYYFTGHGFYSDYRVNYN